MMVVPLRFISLSHVVILALLLAVMTAAEPTVGTDGWSNIPGAVEGAVATRPIDTTVPAPPLGYVEYLPKGYDPTDRTRKWPLVVFISGFQRVSDPFDVLVNYYRGASNARVQYQLILDSMPPGVVVVPARKPAAVRPAA